MKKLYVSAEVVQEARNIVDGIYAPLTGFLKEKDLISVLENMRLCAGEIWPMPIVVDIDENESRELSNETEVTLVGPDGEEIILQDLEVYEPDKDYMAEKLFGTKEIDHPGVKRLKSFKNYFLGGNISSAHFPSKPVGLYITPQETREIFKKNGWEYVVAFQTRNPPHRSHEHIQKTALQNVHGLFVNPVIGPKKPGDFRDEHIIGAYKILIDKYYPENKVLLATFHTYMRYAGPKEAVFHALVRRNFGCTHMIIGRDHAGVGSYYGSYDAHKIFDQFTEKELGIKILKYSNAFFCHDCGEVVMEDVCCHPEEKRMLLSGTQIRSLFSQNKALPEQFMRKEVIDYLLSNRKDLFVK